MACKMNCTLKGDNPKETMEALIKMAESQGFVFKGTSTKGTFEYEKTLKARGEYSRSKRRVTLTVTKYPFFITCGMMKSELNKRLGEYLSCEEG